jgi:hypothetical protein
MKTAMPIDSTPHGSLHLPFANETEVQEFVEKYAEKIFGLKVIASTRRGERGMFKIDVLAVDAANSPFIIECKWDRVGSGANRQLFGYRKTLLDNWPLFERRVSEARGRKVTVERREPVLVAIGYRCAPSVLIDPQSVVFLTYAYHDVTLGRDVVKQQRVGKVSIQHAHQILMPKSRHPSVCKKRSTIKVVARLPPALQKAFWAIDARLCGLDAVTVVRFKNLVNYRVRRVIFAKATISPESIRWRYGQRGVWNDKDMLASCDAKKIFDLLHQAHVDAA